MKKTTKALLMAACALALVLTTVMGTVAYLTSNDTVTNTFTVGKVKITLDEAKVDEYGAPIDGADRVDANTYKLIPGHEYTKDPTIHFEAGSEKSYVFVEVQNGIENYESKTEGYVSITQQIVNNGWTALGDSYPGVYYKEVEANTTDAAQDLKVFSKFKIADNFELPEGTDINDVKVTITAYAIQYDGMTDVNTAWTTVKDAANN